MTGRVSWKSRDSPSARLGSALGRWNSVEQTGYVYIAAFAPTDQSS
jgi:hypothetical protein